MSGMRFTGVCIVVLVLAGAAFATLSASQFPKMRYGIGNEPTAGGGTVANDRYRTQSAVMAWSRKHRTLTLYLIRGSKVSCGTLKKTIVKPGHLIQAWIKARPLRAFVGQPLPDQTLQFLTYSKKGRVNDAGLSRGVRLVITRIDSYPRGVWHGTLKVPTKVYANNLIYGYRGTFAAQWCELRR